MVNNKRTQVYLNFKLSMDFGLHILSLSTGISCICEQYTRHTDMIDAFNINANDSKTAKLLMLSCCDMC